VIHKNSRLVRFVLTAVLCVSGGVSLFAAAKLFFPSMLSARPTQPALQSIPEILDIGNVEQFVSVKSSLSLKNTGNKEIKIVDTRKSCGCSDAVIANPVLKPGESTLVNLVWNTGKSEGKVRLPINFDYVEVGSEDRKQTVTTSIQGIVLTDVSVDPKQIVFTSGKSSLSLKLTTRPDSDIKVIGFKTSDPKISVSAGATLNEYVVSHSKQKDASDTFGDYIVVETNQPSTQWLTIPIEWR
jgi:hypothetical protein